MKESQINSLFQNIIKIGNIFKSKIKEKIKLWPTINWIGFTNKGNL